MGTLEKRESARRVLLEKLTEKGKLEAGEVLQIVGAEYALKYPRERASQLCAKMEDDGLCRCLFGSEGQIIEVCL